MDLLATSKKEKPDIDRLLAWSETVHDFILKDDKTAQEELFPIMN